MNLTELLALVGAELDAVGCPHFTTGSMASTVFGEPRLTNDVDVVVYMSVDQARDFVQRFQGAEWYVSEHAAVKAATTKSQFNLINSTHGLKADLMVVPDDEFNRSRFGRARRLPIGENQTELFASPEDVILKKLQYFREGKSEKHLRDIAAIVSTQGGDRIDWRYMEQWAPVLGVVDELSRVLRA